MVYFLYINYPESRLDFEFDEKKSMTNKAKHGIDFVEAQELWLDERRLEIPARTEDEPRALVIGRIGDRHWSAVVTEREGRVRIISARRSRKEERSIYEG
jgi:uncharacterized protein